MSNKIVQLENEAGDNIYPLAGGALTGSISKTMLEEGVFEGPELSEPSTVAYVATDNIQDGAVTAAKIDSTTIDLMPYAASIVTTGNATAITKGGITSITLNITAQSASTGDKVIFSNLPASIMPQAAPGMFAATTSTGSALSIRARTSDSSIICTFSSTSAISIRATATYISQ